MPPTEEGRDAVCTHEARSEIRPLRLRGLSGAKDEVLLTAIAQNLRRLAKLLCRAPPRLAAASRQVLITMPRPRQPERETIGRSSSPAALLTAAMAWADTAISEKDEFKHYVFS